MKTTQKSGGKSRLSISNNIDKKRNRSISSNNPSKEKQGPIDWSSRGLKSKYRGENEREAAWNLWLSACQYAEKTLTDSDFVIPTVKIERHPFYISYYNHLNEENNLSTSRSKARLLMKRFVFDVQEIWLTNLEHLREYNPKYMGKGHENETETAVENINRGNGLHNRRDIRAIETMESQIQSVSQKRAFANAYHTSRMPNIQVVLDYIPYHTPILKNIKNIPPVIQSLLSGIRLTSNRMFTEATYPEKVYVLYIDRLLPSKDYLHAGVNNEVLWRFSLFCNVNSTAIQRYVCKEQEVASLAAQLILNKSTDTTGISAPYVLCSGLVYSSAQSFWIPCFDALSSSVGQSTKEAYIDMNIAVLGISRRHSDSAIQVPLEYFDCNQDVDTLQQCLDEIIGVKIEFCMTVLSITESGREHEADQTEQMRKVFLECSPAEIQYLLRDRHSIASSVPLGGGRDILWWLHPQRVEEVWVGLGEHLALEIQCDQGGEPMYGISLIDSKLQQQEHRALCSLTGRLTPEQIPGALGTVEALSCAYELLDVIRLAETSPSTMQDSSSNSSQHMHILEIKGSSPSFFSHVQLDLSNDCVPQHDTTVEHTGTQQETTATTGMMQPITERTLTQIRSGSWEQVVDTGNNLSLLASGAQSTITLVPGTCEVGRRGIWFPDHNTAPQEFTQAAARYYRDARDTSSHSILVNMTFALDISLLFDSLLAWEAFSSYPTPCPAEEVDGSTIPALTCPPLVLCAEALVSPIQERPSATVMVFSGLPVEGVDFVPRDTPTLPKGYRRHVPTKNRYGYREQVEVTLLGVDPVLATVVFGVTRTGAIANTTGVNNRNLWHNTLAITEHINRPRAPKDYHYILIRGEHSGSNEPTRYTTRMRADRMVGLTSSAFSTYEDNYAAIQELRDVFNRQVALDAKIEKVESDIIIKQKLLKTHFQNQLQRAIEKKMRKATKSELGWRSRYKMSTLMELQGNWERRRDDRTGMFFFHNLQHSDQVQAGQKDEEQYLQSCQWEVPAQWDGDPLSTEVGGGRERARNLYSGHNDLGMYGRTGGGKNTAASQDSLTAGDLMSDLHEEELDPFDLAPARWDPNPTPQHHNRHQSKEMQQQHAVVRGPAGAFEQPPDSWMPPIHHQSQLGVGDGRTMASSIDSLTHLPDRPPRKRSTQSVASDLNSVNADKSLAESLAPTIDTANLEHIAEQLVSSDELMRVIARRLGLPESQVVPADDLSSVFSMNSGAGGGSSVGAGSQDDRQNPLHAPRDPWMDSLNEPEFDSDDDLWSDDEHEVGDFDEEKEIGAPEDMPQSQLEAAMLRRRELRELRGNRQEIASVPSQIPALDLRHLDRPLKEGEQDIKGDVDEEAAREEVFGWRRLPRPVIRPGFLADALLTHTKPPDATSSNTLNAPVFLMPISPVDACKYYPEEFTTAIESIFVPDAKKDMERSIATVERNIRREEELTRNLPTDDLLLFGEATEFTSADAFLARQRKEDMDQVRDPTEEAREKAILAAKSGNIAMMEDSLAMDADPNTTDEFGNTLLILAAQQGAKRMCKFLLRKGANINKQSIVGNTPLHYCYAYSNIALGEYLKAKGADDSIVNVDKLTCYEGLSLDSMRQMYGDDEEAHMVGAIVEKDSIEDEHI